MIYTIRWTLRKKGGKKNKQKKTEAEGEAGYTERKGAGGNGDRSTNIQDVSMIETCNKNKKKSWEISFEKVFWCIATTLHFFHQEE